MQVNLKSNIIGQYRGAVGEILEALNKANYIVKQVTAMGLTFADADFTEANAGILNSEFMSGYTSMQAIETLLSANNQAHYGNLFKIKP